MFVLVCKNQSDISKTGSNPMVNIRSPFSTKLKLVFYKTKLSKNGGRKTVAVRRLKHWLEGTFGDALRHVKQPALWAWNVRPQKIIAIVGEASAGLKIAMLVSIFVLTLPPYVKSNAPNISSVQVALAASQSDGYISTISAIGVDEARANNFLFVASSAVKSVMAMPVREQVVLRRLLVPITAYSSTVDQTDSTPFITASGTRVRDGVIAANFLPIGTMVKIPSVFGEKVFRVEDRMNKRYWMRADIWMPTREQALTFGLRTLPVEIIGEI